MKNFKIFNCLGNQMPNRNVITILTRKNNQIFMKEESALLLLLCQGDCKLILTEERLKKINSLKTDEKYKKLCDSFISEAEKNLENTSESTITLYLALIFGAEYSFKLSYE